MKHSAFEAFAAAWRAGRRIWTPANYGFIAMFVLGALAIVTVICTDPKAETTFSEGEAVSVGISPGNPGSPSPTVCVPPGAPPPTSPAQPQAPS